MKKYPDGTILDLLSHYFGKWAGKIGALIFAIYFALFSTVIFTREALFIQAWILPGTAIYTLVILLTIPSYLIVKNNISILARYSELIYFVTVISVIFLLIPFKDGEWLYLLPVVKTDWMSIISTVKIAVLS